MIKGLHVTGTDRPANSQETRNDSKPFPKKPGKKLRSEGSAAIVCLPKNPYEALADLVRDNKTITDELKGFITSSNRHGAVEVINSCLRHMLDNIAVLRAVEEEL